MKNVSPHGCLRFILEQAPVEIGVKWENSEDIHNVLFSLLYRYSVGKIQFIQKVSLVKLTQYLSL